MEDFKKLLQEAIGSIQYKNDKLKLLLSDISKDIYSRDNQNSYDITYDNINDNYGIKWIKRLDIIVKNNVFSRNDAVALIEDSNSTIFTDNYIELATIIISNPLNQPMLTHNIAHELNHYVKYYNLHKNDKHANDTDLDIVKDTPHTQIDFINEYDNLKESIKTFIKSDFTSYGFIKSMFLEILYYMNKSEVNAHMENVYGEILKNKTFETSQLSDISDTYRLYQNINELLNLFLSEENKEFNWYKEKYLIPIITEIFPKISFRKSINRLITRNNTFLKKALKLFNDIK